MFVLIAIVIMAVEVLTLAVALDIREDDEPSRNVTRGSRLGSK